MGNVPLSSLLKESELLLFFEKTSSMSTVTRVLKIPSSQYPNTETQSRQIHTFTEELILNTFSEHCELPTHSIACHCTWLRGGILSLKDRSLQILLEDYQSTWQYSVPLGSAGPFILAMSGHCVQRGTSGGPSSGIATLSGACFPVSCQPPTH